MKKILVFNALLWFFSCLALAQGGLLLNDVRVTCNGYVTMVIENGRWKNTISTFDHGNSKVKFTGNASAPNSVIEGNSTTFYNLEIAKSQNNLRLVTGTTNVVNDLTFTTKNLDLNGKVIALGVGADLVLESENARSYSALPLSSITKTYSLNNPSNFHFGGMGIRITASGFFSNTTVDRRHKAQTLPTGDGIQKYWRLSTTNNPAGQNATLRFNYFDAELNGLNEANLSIWRSTNNGASWTDMGIASRSTTANYVEQTALTEISGWWTLGAAPPIIGPSDERLEAPSNLTTDLKPDFAWSIFPNPASQWVTVSILSPEEKMITVELLSTDKKIGLSIQHRVVKGENAFLLDVESLEPGVYFACVVGQPFQPISLVKIR